MPRTVKDPEERKAELLDTAMRLFAEKGYDNVSVRSVAREAGVASGLAYHYFDSKQRLFDAAIGHYAERCSEGMRAALDDGALSLDEKIEGAIAAATEHAAFPHGSRLHAEGNGTLHDRLSLG
ncbi:TetR/AcrR family transcriptional regulator, partial [Gordonibacter pamelaeae]|uniref:TetR/AcrR family transcriptional regulator n=2 Tax=Eggerthellales TaxID=1643822 RepID=UPI00059DB933